MIHNCVSKNKFNLEEMLPPDIISELSDSFLAIHVIFARDIKEFE